MILTPKPSSDARPRPGLTVHQGAENSVLGAALKQEGGFRCRGFRGFRV